MLGLPAAANNLIQGTMPNALRNLTGLRKLALNSNLMHGTVPDWLGELQSLVTLNLAGLQGAPPCGQFVVFKESVCLAIDD